MDIKDMKFKTTTCKVLDAPKGKPIVAEVSNRAEDSDGDIIYQGPNSKGRGWILDDFNKRGGRFYYMHEYWVPNLAKGRAWLDDAGNPGERLLISPEFDEQDEFAMFLDGKVRRGYLDEWSVGFVPVIYERRSESQHGSFMYEQILWETSLVNQGANPETITFQKSAMRKSVQDAADIVKMYEDRIKNLETLVMRMSNEKQADREHVLREAYEAINQIRSRV